MTLTVHHMNISQSERVVFLCEELGLDYELKVHPRNEQGLAPESIKALHPAGTAPVIVDTTSNGEKIIMAESSAILEYIDRLHGKGRLSVRPEDGAAKYADFLEWFHFVNGTLQANFGRLMIIGRMGEEALQSPPAKFVEGKVERILGMYESQLGKGKWMVGETFTLVDCMTVFTLTTMRGFYPRDLSAFPNILRYLRDIGERPAYQSAMKKGDPDLKPMLGGPAQKHNINLPQGKK